MTRSWTPRLRLPNRAIAALAFLALVFAILVPPGFMPTSEASGPGFAIVICTGHGPLQLDPSSDHKAPPGKSKAGTACPFAANVTPPVLPDIAFGARPAAFGVVTLAAVSHQAPGRGLAAPPPPATGPPSLI
ncbi:MAG TPA: DUF2946 family protein [Caulobacteraceae bacterium]|nr:DUF2946 family protein [Caulobacteraceae bacterium]